MASLRPGMRYPPGQGEVALSRRMENIPSHSTALGKPAPRELHSTSGLTVPSSSSSSSSYFAASPTGRSHITSKIPQTASAPAPSSSSPRKPPEPRQKAHARPPLTHQSQSWGSGVSSSSSVRSQPNANSPSGRALRYPRNATGSNVPASVGPPGDSQRGKPSGVRSRNNSGEISSSSSVTGMQTPLDLDRGLTESPTELRLAKKAEVTSAHTVTIYPELDRYRDIQPLPNTVEEYGFAHPDVLFRLATRDLPPPPTPHFSGTNSLVSGISGSPSTRFSESPGPGPYSRDTTPTSISSHSPGLISSVRIPSAPRTWQASRGRAASFGKDSSNENSGIGAGTTTHTLAAIRESLNSSSSSSNGTVRGGDKREKIKKKRLSPLPPSPPPRKSSQKFKPSDDEQDSPSGPLARPARPARPNPPPQYLKAAKPATATTSSSPAKKTTPAPAPSTSGQQRRAVTSPRPTPQPMPPRRPSRDGTPDLQSQLDYSLPIIQSNLASTSLSDRRTSLHAATLPSPGRDYQQHQYNQQRSLTPSSLQPQQPLHPPRLPTSREGAAAPLQATTSGPNCTPPSTVLAARAESRQGGNSDKESGRTTRTPSPSVSTFRTRFPLFGRRTKTAPVPSESAATVEKKEKSARKGPAAGTGHEGYGRLGHSRRRSSSVSNFLRGTASSQEDLGSPQFQDPFLRDRLSPVVIAGGEVIDNQNIGPDLTRVDSNTIADAGDGTDRRRPSTGSRNDSQVSLSSREGRTTLWPSAIPQGSRQVSPWTGRSRRPSDSSDSDAGVMRSTLAFRRSVQRLRSPDRAQVRLPKPIVVRQPPTAASTSVNSLDTSIMTDDSIPETRPNTSRGRKGSFSTAATSGTKKLTKRTRSPRKWNLFGRSQSQPATIKKGLESTSTVAVTVEAALPAEKTKPVAFYAMIDSSEQEDGDMEVEDVLREAHVLGSPLAQFSESRERRPSASQVGPHEDLPLLPPPQLQVSQQVSHPGSPSSAQQHQQHQLRQRRGPSASPARSARDVQPQVPAQGTAASDPSPRPFMTRTGRPSRLPQVGRIPKVISARPEQTSPRSFSRPFNRVSVQMSSAVSPGLNSLDADSVAKGPSPPKSTTPELMHDGSTVTGSSADPTVVRLRLSHTFTLDAEHIDNDGEFLAFLPRKDSQTTSGTSSSGLFSFADATAVVPDANAPLAEDEVWDEYNDLLGEETLKVPPSAGSSQGLPFHLETAKAPTSLSPLLAKARKTRQEGETTLESPTDVPHHNPKRSIDETIHSDRPPVASSVYSTDVAAQVGEVVEEQRTSTLNQVPSTPFSVTEFVSGYGDRNNSGIAPKNTEASQRSSSSSHRSSKRKARGSDGSVYSQVSEDSSPISQVNLRVGSMTVSKWLTFGHVLFSPARDDMVLAVSPPNGHSVLVIDGLGNDDWSFYAAETYPAATFFNLSPRAPLPMDHQTGAVAFPISPPNHHQIQYTSHADKLPFQSEIFTTVVFRFPAAAPESHYRNIINEARRVLKPGGYLELSILDLDLNNMGNRTRRAIRRLKEQIHAQAPDMHLGSTADVILRLLGTRGFTDIKSCRVGIPVASAIPQTSSEASAGGSAKQLRSVGKGKKDQRSLAEMINDESPVADESITNMVARVGRWWHSRCYGDAAIEPLLRSTHNATGNSSMWMDRALLAECEEWRTNLKLMVCYARVPDIRRMASI